MAARLQTAGRTRPHLFRRRAAAAPARRCAPTDHLFSTGFADVVVWNPGAELAARLPDLPDDDWRQMLCVEAAAIGKPVEVLPGECWIGRQTIDVGDVLDAADDANG